MQSKNISIIAKILYSQAQFQTRVFLLLHHGDIASLPGLSTVQFWAVYKDRGGRPGPFYHVNDVSVYQGKQRGGEGRGGVLLRKKEGRGGVLLRKKEGRGGVLL